MKTPVTHLTRQAHIPVFYRLIRLNLASIVGTVTSWEGDG